MRYGIVITEIKLKKTGVHKRMKKKLILAAAGAMAVFSLAACSSGSKEIATMKGSTITVDDFYNQIKEQSTSQ